MIQHPALLASLFSNSFLKRVIESTHLEYLQKVLIDTNFDSQLSQPATFSSTMNEAFDYLKNHYRCEYVFKTGVLNELLKRHDLNEAIYLTEFRAFNTKADVLVLNGTSTVYEIKSDVDNFNRLLNQVSVYEQLFDKVFVVSNETNVSKIRQIVPKNTGIIVLDQDLTMSTEKEAKSNISKLNKSLMFDSLRKTEYIPMIKEAFGYVPSVPNTAIHKECCELFLSLSNKKAHKLFMGALKQRQLSKSQIELVSEVNIGLKSAISEKFYSENDCKSIKFALNQSLFNNVFTLHQSQAT